MPPLSLHALAETVVIHPLPLHEFCPMHPLLALLHELCPLQLFPPMHFTLLELAELVEELCANRGVLRNIAPTAAAKSAPLTVLRSIVTISPFRLMRVTRRGLNRGCAVLRLRSTPPLPD